MRGAHLMLQPTTTTATSGPRQPRLPPSAPGGNILLGGARDFQQDTIKFIQTLAAIGDVVRYRFVVWPTYFVNHPDYIKHVLQENYRHYNKDVPINRILTSVLGNGLITNDGA